MKPTKPQGPSKWKIIRVILALLLSGLFAFEKIVGIPERVKKMTGFLQELI